MNLPTTMIKANPEAVPSSEAFELAGDRFWNGNQPTIVSGEQSCSDHFRLASQIHDVAASRDDDQAPNGAQAQTVVVSASFRLQFAAEFLTDTEGLRISTENRLRQLAIEAPGVDLRVYREQALALAAIEHQAVLELQRAMRAHPYGGWVKQTLGVGEKQGARLIAAIGDVVYNHAADRQRRGPAELWAYCGYAPGQKRRKGVRSNWNATAKMRAFLVAESCMKKRDSPFRADYDRARANWADRDVSDGHKHNHALRVVAKEVLKSLFLYAKAAQ